MDTPASKVYLLEPTDDDHFHWWELGRAAPTDPHLPLNKLPRKKWTEQIAPTRHGGGANYLYADGHAKWARIESLWGVTRDTNAFWP